MTLPSAAITLLLVMDPFGNIPAFVSILKNVPARRRRLVILREMVIALGALTLFLFFGRYILEGMGIGEPALGIAGGIILFLIAIRMIFPARILYSDDEAVGEPIIVPLAIPLIAGPSSMATVILLSTQYPGRNGTWFLALFAAWTATSLVLLLSESLCRVLGDRVLKAIERLMGMILTTLAVQMLLTGIGRFLDVV